MKERPSRGAVAHAPLSVTSGAALALGVAEAMRRASAGVAGSDPSFRERALGHATKHFGHPPVGVVGKR